MKRDLKTSMFMFNFKFFSAMKMSFKTLLLALLAIWVVACQKQEENDNKHTEDGYFDSQRYPGILLKEDLRTIRRVNPKSSTGAGNTNESIPSHFDLMPKMPPVHPIGQGYNGACISWASSTIVSYLQHIKNNTPYTEETIMSPSYLYSQLRKLDEQGREISEYIPTFDKLKEEGICSMADKPFDEYNVTPNSYQRRQAKYNRISDYKRISFSEIKENIAKGLPVLAGFYLSRGEKGTFRMPYVDRQNRHIWNNNSNQETYAHAAVIVAYDDYQRLYTLYNSWGTNQGEYDGLVYVEYDILEKALQRHYGVETLFVFYLDDNKDQNDNPIPRRTDTEEKISISINSFQLPEAEVGDSSNASFPLQNEGKNTQLHLRIEGEDASYFHTANNMLLNEQARTIQVVFTPNRAGLHTARLIITTDEGFYHSIKLNAIGKIFSTPRPEPKPEPRPEPEPQPDPQKAMITLSTNYLSFETQERGVEQKEVELTNTGNATTYANLRIDGDSAFQLYQNNQVTLWPGSSVRAFITYVPERQGYHSGTLIVSYDGKEERVSLSGRAEKRSSYVIREDRPYSDLDKAYCRNAAMNKTYARHIGIDLQGSSVEEQGNRLRVRLKVIKIDENIRFKYGGKIYHKIGRQFCTKNFNYELYNGGNEAIYMDFFIDKSEDTVWVLADSNNGERFYTKVVIQNY